MIIAGFWINDTSRLGCFTPTLIIHLFTEAQLSGWKLCQSFNCLGYMPVQSFSKLRKDKLVVNSGVSIQVLLLSESVLNFRRVTGMLDLGECLSLDANNLPPAVYLSSLPTLQLSSEGQEFKTNGALCYNCPVKISI